MSPPQKARAKELYPEFYAARKKLLKQQTKNLFKLAKIKLEGIETFDDLKTTYLAESGRLDLGPLQNLLHPETGEGTMDQRAAQKRFVRGLANPFQVWGKEAYPDTGYDRQLRAQDYAARDLKDKTYDYGITANRGFPGFDQGAGGQGDKQWWQVLNSGISGMQ